MQEVIEALTSPLDAEDVTGLSFDRSAPRLLSPDSEENLQQLFLQNHWTDCLPITLPTEARVEAMLTEPGPSSGYFASQRIRYVFALAGSFSTVMRTCDSAIGATVSPV